MANAWTTILQSVLSSVGNLANNPATVQALGSSMVQQSQTQTSIKSLIALATPLNAASISTQIAALPNLPPTVTPLLMELAEAKDQATITAIGLQIEASLNANTGLLGGLLSGVGL